MYIYNNIGVKIQNLNNTKQSSMDILETMTDFFTKASLEEARKNCSPMQDSFDQCLAKIEKKGGSFQSGNRPSSEDWAKAEELMRPCLIFSDNLQLCLKKHLKRK